MSSLRGDVLGELDGLSAAFEFELGLFLGDLEDVDRVGDVLFRMIGHHLHPGLGVRISMDDFGTGYSSIGYLRSFPFDKIKIDQTFVRDVLVDEGSLAIVRAIAGLGVSFGMITTAEGVETEEQMRCLNLEGCIEVKDICIAGQFRPTKLPGFWTTWLTGDCSRAISIRAIRQEYLTLRGRILVLRTKFDFLD